MTDDIAAQPHDEDRPVSAAGEPRKKRAPASKKIYGVVCGMPRCGTRNFASLLNKYRHFAIQAEIPFPLLEGALKLIQNADSTFEKGNPKVPPIWRARRYDAIAGAIMLVSKANPLVRRNAIVQGFKLPNAEFESDLLDEVLLPSVSRVHYMYCIRNPVDCYLSLSAMPWFRRTAEGYIQNYIRSLNRICDMKQKAVASGAQVSFAIFNLDTFIAAKSQARWLSQNMFAPLDVEVSPKRCQLFLESMGYINSTKQATGKDREKTLPPDAIEVFQSKKPRLRHAIAKFNAVFEEDLLLNFV